MGIVWLRLLISFLSLTKNLDSGINFLIEPSICALGKRNIIYCIYIYNIQREEELFKSYKNTQDAGLVNGTKQVLAQAGVICKV